MLVWTAAVLPAIMGLLVLSAEVFNWYAVSHELQTAVDAAALAGAREVYIRQEVDAAGEVWTEQVYMDAGSAREKAAELLSANLARVTSAGLLSVTDQQIDVDPDGLTVRVEVTAQVRMLLADRFGLRPASIVRMGTATPVLN